MNKIPKRRILILTGLIILVAICGLALVKIDPVSAQNSSATKVIEQTNTGEIAGIGEKGFDSYISFSPIVKMFAALIIVILSIYVGLMLLKKAMNKGAAKGQNGRALLEVLQSAYVGPKKTVSLIRVADRTVLIGVTEQQISVLTELDADETAVALAVEEVPVAVDSSFRDSLSSLMTRFGRREKEKIVAQQG